MPVGDCERTFAAAAAGAGIALARARVPWVNQRGHLGMPDEAGAARRVLEGSGRYRASKSAVGFGEGGIQRQRAYHDPLRDLATPAMEMPPVVRVPAPDRDGTGAYERVRERLLALAG